MFKTYEKEKSYLTMKTKCGVEERNRLCPKIQNERNSNLELYRIIVMLLIVAHHYVVNSGLMDTMLENPLSSNSLFYFLFGAWGKTGINCFVLITGYFMCTKNITLRKFLKLYLWIVLYNVIITSIFILSGYQCFSWKSLLVLLPIRNIHSDSFVSAFLVWWLFIPFLNVLINNLTRKSHLMLIVLTFIVFSIYPFVYKFFYIDLNPICWFSTIYIITSYIRKYPEYIPKESSAHFWRRLSIVLILLGMFSIYFILLLSTHFNKYLYPYYMISDSQQPLSLFISISTFMWFKNIRIKNSKIINTIAASSFGVLLIHANSDAMRQWLRKDTIDCVGHYATDYYWLYAIGCVVAIYFICTIIDIIRIKTIEKPILNITERLCKKTYACFTQNKTL